MKFRFFFVVVALVCARCLAGEAGDPQYLASELVVVKTFFEEFKNAFNSKDIERVRKMSGNSSKRWLRWMQGKEKLGEVGINSWFTNIEQKVTVSAKVNVSGSDKGPYAFDAVFTLRKDRGIYSIEDMALPKSENLNQEFDKAVAVGKRLIVAINDRDLNAAKETVSFGNAADFESELAIRGLSWIKNAIDHRVTIPEESMIMSRDGKEMLVGRVKVPCAPDGTNILRKVIFMAGKIDRAAPREGTKEEFLRRFEKEKAEARLRLEKEDAERERRQREEALKYLQKRMK